MEISGGLSQNLASSFNTNQQQFLQPEANNRVTSKTAPARLEGFDDENDESNALFKVFFLIFSKNKISIHTYRKKFQHFIFIS